jgi:hypothetical protein
VVPFYSSLPGPGVNSSEIESDLFHLNIELLVRYTPGLGRGESLPVWVGFKAAPYVDGLQEARSKKKRRSAACRDAMVDWLYSRDATATPGVARQEMLQDRRGYFFAELFTEGDLGFAADWLQRHGLVDGTTAEEARGPVVIYLTPRGVEVVEGFKSDTARYLEKQEQLEEQRRKSGPKFSGGTFYGPLQFAGDHAHQEQNVRVSAAGQDGLGRQPQPAPQGRLPVRSPTMEESAGHAFLSYVREDSDRVDELQRYLEAAGIPVWRDTANLWPGQDWRKMIRRAITDNALVFITCFSSQSLTKEKSYQNEELALAIDQLRQRQPDDPWLIPVRLDDCQVPDLDIGAGRTLGSIHRADLYGDHYEQQIDRLVRSVQRLLGPRRPG